MTLLAMCFATGVLSSVVGALLVFALARPKVVVALDFVSRSAAVCPSCGHGIGPLAFVEVVPRQGDLATVRGVE